MYRYFLALRYLLSRPINLLGMAGVMVSVWALIVVVSIFSGFLVEVRAHVRSANSDITVLSLPSPASYSRVAKTIESVPNVAATAPRLIWFGMLKALGATHQVMPRTTTVQAPGAEVPFVMLLGIDAQREANVTGFSEWLAAVEDPALRVDDPDDPFRPALRRLPDGTEKELPAILLSERRLQHEFVGKGAIIKISSAELQQNNRERQQQLDFIDHYFVVAGAYATRHHEFDNQNCFLHIDTLRAMMDSDGVDDSTTQVIARCVDPSDNAATAGRIDRALRPLFPGRLLDHFAYTWQELNEGILSAVDHQRSLMKLVLFVIMVVAAFLMFATLSMMVTEKTHDIGILTAMGATRRGVMQVFLSCGLAIVLLGSILGIATGCFSALYLDEFNRWLRASFDIDLFPPNIYNLKRVPHDLDPLWITQVAGMALGLGLLVSGLPAWRAARHDPLESLRNE